MHKFHFISGLPRSGSTLLSALLRQNPRFHAGMSGPLSGMMATMLADMSGRNEFSVFIDDEQRQRVLRGIADSFYADNPAELVFDTSRAWCVRMGLINKVFPQARVIACVRHVPWIVDSIERLIQRNTFQPSYLFNYTVGGTVYSRCEGVTKADGMVGYAYNALREAYFGEHASKLMLLQYESLVTDPPAAMAALYDFIGEPAFKHDFERVEYAEGSAFDRKASTPGLHSVRPKVQAVDRDTILPPDLFKRLQNDAFWRNKDLNKHGVRIV